MTRDKIQLKPLHLLLLAGSFCAGAGAAGCRPRSVLPACTAPASSRPALGRTAPARATESQPAPLLGAVVGLCADQWHPSIPVLQPHGATSPPSRWPAVDHCPGTVPKLAFNSQSDLGGECCRVGAMLGTRSSTMDGDPAQYRACLSHPGMTCPLHPCHSSYGLGETNGSGGDTGSCRGVLLLSARTRCPGSWRLPAGPQGIPHTLGRDTALDLAELLWDRDVPFSSHSSTAPEVHPALRCLPCPTPPTSLAEPGCGQPRCTQRQAASARSAPSGPARAGARCGEPELC